MCGIAGVMMRRPEPPDEMVLTRLTDALAHRGPDGRGCYVAGSTALVHTRLAIIDLETGDQPLRGVPRGAHEGDGPVVLVANGEIYNDLSVRERLGGGRYTTGSDCETPLQLYLDHGSGFADLLRGMYAMALHDPRAGGGAGGRLILARDPFGIKPLYYVERDDGFAFASEPQALIAAGLVAPMLRDAGRDELLQLQFVCGRSTVFAGIERLLPGETLVVEAGRVVERRRRDALPAAATPRDRADADALSDLDGVLEDSVRLHQRSDVPYGLFLSGGIDSSAVLAMMARLAERPVLAFTVGFAGTAAADERGRARAAARSVGAEHVEVTFGADDFWSLLPQVAAAMDDPACDYAALPTFKLAAAARAAGIKVVLSGEGGDEMFAGYGRYRRALRPRLFGGRPAYGRGVFDGLGVLRGGAGWRRGMAAAERAAALPGRSRLCAAQAVDVAEWLPNDLLGKLDRCLMAHGVEGRVPLVDPEVARFAFGLPDRLSIGGGIGKRILRQWLAQALPAAAPFARKQGFTVPVAEWIGGRARHLGPLVAGQPGVAEACEPAAVTGLFDAVAAGRKRAGQAAWTLLFYALWHHRHVLGRPADGDVFATLSQD